MGGEREPTVDGWEEVCSNAFSTTDAKMQRRKTTTHFRTSIKQCAEDAELDGAVAVLLGGLDCLLFTLRQNLTLCHFYMCQFCCGNFQKKFDHSTITMTHKDNVRAV